MSKGRPRKFNWERAEKRLRRAITDLNIVRVDIWDNSDTGDFDRSIGECCEHLMCIADQLHAAKVKP